MTTYLRKALYLTLCMIALHPAQGIAQSDYLFASEDTRRAETVELGGQSSFVFESKCADLIITSSINSDAQKPKAEKVGGIYRYELVVPANGKRIFTVAKAGTALRTDIPKLPRQNQRFYFTVTEVENPITMENQSGSGNLYPVERKACIQFTTPISDLQVQFSPKLGGKLNRNKTADSGANLILLEVDIDSLNKYRNHFSDVQARYDEINKTIQAKEKTDIKSITDQEYDLEERLKDELTRAQNDWIEVATIKVFGENTNVITLPVSDILAIQAKSLTPYGILLLKEKVFASKYDELMHQAKEYMERRDYELAGAHYASAAEVSGISEVDKITAKRSSEKMGTLHTYKQHLDTQADNLYKVTHAGGMINKKQLFGMIDELITLNKAMYKETTDTYYLEEANRLAEEKQNVGVVIKGRFVMSEYKGGVVQETPITNVRIYGSQDMNNDNMDKPTYFNKGELITTVTSADGHFSFNYPLGKYRSIIFEAVNNPQIKDNKHISVLGNTDDRNLKIRFPKK